ncbi:MAG: hypothetical protein IKB07_10990 [Lachnospiraceae bacterium]|nr:hypothetical protein [Lachnospiraceae bacterium]
MNDLKRFCVIGFFVTTVLGILSHFVYDWTGRGFLIGLFFPVNESTWEHMKLLFFPMFLFALVAGKRIEQQYPCIYNAMFTGILVGLALIPTLFYTYSGILGYHVAWANIAAYILCVLLAYVVVYKGAMTCKNKDSKVLRIVMYGLVVAFMVFTVYPPEIGLFEVPPPEGMR